MPFSSVLQLQKSCKYKLCCPHHVLTGLEKIESIGPIHYLIVAAEFFRFVMNSSITVGFSNTYILVKMYLLMRSFWGYSSLGRTTCSFEDINKKLLSNSVFLYIWNSDETHLG